MRWPAVLTVGPCGQLGHVLGHFEDGWWWCADCCDHYAADVATWKQVA